MVNETPRLGLNTYEQGDENWSHTDAVEAVDERAIERGSISDRPAEGEYDDELFAAVDQRIIWRWDEGESDWKAFSGLGSDGEPVPETSYFEALEAESVSTEQAEITGDGPNVFHDIIVAEGGLDMDGNEILNFDGDFDAAEAERIGSMHFAENYEGDDADERLDNAFADGGQGSTIILEDAIYEKERTGSDAIDTRYRLVGVSQAGERSGATTLGATWELATNMIATGFHGWDGSQTNDIIVKNRSFISKMQSLNITIDADEVVVSMVSNSNITIEDGRTDGVIGVRSRSSVSGDDNGYQKVVLEDV